MFVFCAVKCLLLQGVDLTFTPIGSWDWTLHPCDPECRSSGVRNWMDLVDPQQKLCTSSSVNGSDEIVDKEYEIEFDVKKWCKPPPQNMMSLHCDGIKLKFLQRFGPIKHIFISSILYSNRKKGAMKD